MSFLNFRQARRKAKQIVSIRSLRPPTPPSPSSFGSTEVVDIIVDPSGTSAETYSSPLADVDITPEPLFPNDTLLSTFRDHGWTTTPRQSRDRLSRSKQYRSSSRLLPQDGTGSVRSKDGRSSGSIVVGDVTSTPGSRRAARVTPAPIKIPSAHASRVQIRQSARKSADPHPPSTYPGESPIVDDGASAISGITLPGTLIANVWTLHTDQPRDHRVSRRITRMDSATLPAGDNPFTGSPARNSSRLSNRDNGNSLVPPMPPLPAGINSAATSRPTSEPGKGDAALGDSVPPNLQSSSRDESSQETTDVQVFSSCESSQISPIAEPTAAEASGSGTPDLIKDSPTSADGGSSDAQPETSPSEFTPSAWSGPASGSPPPSGQEITMVLDAFPPLPSQAGGIIDECNLDEDVGSRKLRTASRRTSAGPKVRHSRRSLSSSRPSLASVNTLLLHPATLHPIGEQQISSIRSASEPSVGSQGAALDDAAALSALQSRSSMCTDGFGFVDFVRIAEPPSQPGPT
ncbi:hypothetical protein BC826DRAFT_1101883 [Russula brevipes]|nr:hypothetical protein BC826DRAFT_1101883 [Russula brevipes]